MGRTDAHGAYEPLLCDIPQNLSNSFNAPKLRSDSSAAFTRSARIGFSKLRTLRCASQSTSNMNTCDAPDRNTSPGRLCAPYWKPKG